jgi:hypothetical protein
MSRTTSPSPSPSTPRHIQAIVDGLRCSTPTPTDFATQLMARLDNTAWRLLLDFAKQNNEGAQEARRRFDSREKGYTQAMCNALNFVVDTLDVPLSATWLKELHTIAVSGVSVERFTDTMPADAKIEEDELYDEVKGRSDLIGQFRDEDIFFDFTDSSFTKEGLALILQKMYAGETHFALARDGSRDTEFSDFSAFSFIHAGTIGQYLTYCKKESRYLLLWKETHPKEIPSDAQALEALAHEILSIMPEGQRDRYSLCSCQCEHIKYVENDDLADVEFEPYKTTLVKSGLSAAEIQASLETHVDKLFDDYRTAIASAEGHEEQVLLAIATLIVDLEQTHPFYDGNCRSFGVQVLLRCLFENKLAPSIMDDPNCIDGLTPKQVVIEIKKGMENCNDIIAKPICATPSPVRRGEATREGAAALLKAVGFCGLTARRKEATRAEEEKRLSPPTLAPAPAPKTAASAPRR